MQRSVCSCPSIPAILAIALLVAVVASPRVAAMADQDTCISLEVHTGTAEIAWQDYINYKNEGQDDLAMDSRQNYDHEMDVAGTYDSCDDNKAMGKYYALEAGQRVYDINTFQEPLNQSQFDAVKNLVDLLHYVGYEKRDTGGGTIGYFVLQGEVVDYAKCMHIDYTPPVKPPQIIIDLERGRDPCQTASGILTPQR